MNTMPAGSKREAVRTWDVAQCGCGAHAHRHADCGTRECSQLAHIYSLEPRGPSYRGLKLPCHRRGAVGARGRVWGSALRRAPLGVLKKKRRGACFAFGGRLVLGVLPISPWGSP